MNSNSRRVADTEVQTPGQTGRPSITIPPITVSFLNAYDEDGELESVNVTALMSVPDGGPIVEMASITPGWSVAALALRNAHTVMDKYLTTQLMKAETR